MKIINCFLLLLFCNYLYGQHTTKDSILTFKKIEVYEKEFEVITNKVFKIIKLNTDSTENYSINKERKEISHILINQNKSSLYKVINFYFLHNQLFKVTINYQTLDYRNLKGNGRYYFENEKLLYKEENHIESDISQLISQSNVYLQKGEFLYKQVKASP